MLGMLKIESLECYSFLIMNFISRSNSSATEVDCIQSRPCAFLVFYIDVTTDRNIHFT